MTFERFSLDARVLAGVKAAGFSTPTPIQEQAIPHALNRHDILGTAQTGTGKTAAFLLPILQRLQVGPRRRVRALIVAPTRELAEQIREDALTLGRRTGLRVVTVYGGVSRNRQVEKLRKGAEIVVACPGRLLDLAGDRSIDLSHVEVLVLDEADRMCDMGFLPDIKRILHLVPKQRQTLFFSATMPKEIRLLSKAILNDPVRVQIGEIAPADTVSHTLYPVSHGLKKQLLLATLEQTPTGKVLVFTRTKHRAKNLARDLNKKKYRATDLQGNLSQNRRQQAINGFRNGKFDILVATDVASRGIDVADISHVINFDMPDTVDAYTHRIGRTGRVDKTGEALTFMAHGDEAIVRDIEKLLGEPIERRRLPDFDYGARPAQGQSRGNAGSSGSGRRGNGNGKGNNGYSGKRRTAAGPSQPAPEGRSRPTPDRTDNSEHAASRRTASGSSSQKHGGRSANSYSKSKRRRNGNGRSYGSAGRRQ